MHYQVLVRVLHGVADMSEKLADFPRRPSPAPFVDGAAFDQLHHEVGRSILGGAGVNQAADVGMIQVGENLALTFESLNHEVAADRPGDELDGYPQPDLAIGTFGLVNRTHATASDLANQAVRAHFVRGGGRDALLNAGGYAGDRRAEVGSGAAVEFDESLHGGAGFGIDTLLVEIALASGGIEVSDGEEETFDLGVQAFNS